MEIVTDKLTRLGHPTKLTEQPKMPFHTAHFSMYIQQLHSSFMLGLLIYVSNDFKMNSAYQQGITAPPLKLMRVADPSPQKSPWGHCATPSPHSQPCSARGEVSHLLGTCSQLNGPFCKQRIMWNTPLNRVITLKEKSLIFSPMNFYSLIIK